MRVLFSQIKTGERFTFHGQDFIAVQPVTRGCCSQLWNAINVEDEKDVRWFNGASEIKKSDGDE